MSIPLLLSLLLSAPTEGPLVVAERIPLAVGLLVPTGQRGPATRSEVLNALDDELQKRTDFALASIGEEEPLRRIAASGAAPLSRFCEEALSVAPGSPFLLLLEYRTPYDAGEPSSIKPILLDLDAYRGIRAAPEQERDRRLLEVAVPGPFEEHLAPEPPVLGSRGELERYVAALLSSVLRPSLGAHWGAFRDVEVVTPEPGMTIRIDGRTVGTSVLGETHLSQVPVGRRKLSLLHPDYSQWDGEIVVTSSSAALVFAPEPVTHVFETHRTLRTITFWTGAVAATVGAGFLIAAAAQDKDELACWGMEICSGVDEWATIGEDGPPTAPVGYVLLGGGVTTAVAIALTPDGTLPWLAWVAGAAVTGAMMGAFVAAGGGGE